MPEHNPEDRVRIKNIVKIEEDDVQQFSRTKYYREPIIGPNGEQTTRERQEQERFNWNFKDGFFFAWGQQYYWLKPGEQKTYSRFLAEHAANKMIDYILTKEYLATKTVDSDGVPHYQNNILQNPQKREKLLNEIIMGVEEWSVPNNDTFDMKLAREFGGNFENEITSLKNNADITILDEVDQGVPSPKVPERKTVPPTSDPELKKIREEADLYEINYTEKDTIDTIKARIIKAMG